MKALNLAFMIIACSAYLLGCKSDSDDARGRTSKPQEKISLPPPQEDSLDTKETESQTSGPAARSFPKALNSIGYTIRADGADPIVGCKNGTVMPELVAFLSKLAHYIMGRNPETFSNNFSADRMCFNVQVNPEPNAVSSFNEGSITFYTGMIQRFTDIQGLAFVMSHELAHKTLSHENDYPLVAENNAAFMKEAALYKKVESDLVATDKAYEASCRKLAAQAPAFASFPQISFASLQKSFATTPPGIWIFDCRPLYDRLAPITSKPPQGTVFNREVLDILEAVKLNSDLSAGLTKQEAELKQSLELKFLSFYEFKGRSMFNWREIEADLVGYEFYRRAGFAALLGPFDFAKPIGSCNYDLVAGLPPDPGTALSHPAPCYRRYYMEKDESAIYKGLQGFPLETTAVEVWNEEFRELKAKLKL